MGTCNTRTWAIIIRYARLLQRTDYELVVRHKVWRLLAPSIGDQRHNEEEWQGAYRWSKVACERLLERIKDCVIVGHNVEFDINFIREECKRQGVWCPRFRHLIPKVWLGSYGLTQRVCQWITSERTTPNTCDRGSHRAMKDVDDCT